MRGHRAGSFTTRLRDVLPLEERYRAMQMLAATMKSSIRLFERSFLVNVTDMGAGEEREGIDDADADNDDSDDDDDVEEEDIVTLLAEGEEDVEDRPLEELAGLLLTLMRASVVSNSSAPWATLRLFKAEETLSWSHN